MHEVLVYSMMLIYLIIAFFVGYYSVMSLRLLLGNKELYETQGRIWFPILLGGGFLIASPFAMYAHDMLATTGGEALLLFLFCLTHLLSVFGLTFLVIGLRQYYLYWAKYVKLKMRGVGR